MKILLFLSLLLYSAFLGAANLDGVIIRPGYDATGSLQNVGQTVENGAPITSDFYYQIQRGNIPGASYIHSFGRNKDVDVASGFEATWC